MVDAPPWLITWLDAWSVWDFVLLAAGVLGAIVFVKRKGWRAVIAFARAILATAEVIDNVRELPAFIARTDELHKNLAEKVDGIHHETHTNKGSSIKDALSRVEETTERLEIGVRGLYDKVGELAAEDARLAAADEQIRKDMEDTQPSKE